MLDRLSVTGDGKMLKEEKGFKLETKENRGRMKGRLEVGVRRANYWLTCNLVTNYFGI